MDMLKMLTYIGIAILAMLLFLLWEYTGIYFFALLAFSATIFLTFRKWTEGSYFRIKVTDEKKKKDLRIDIILWAVFTIGAFVHYIFFVSDC
jgi:hypothetical protein